MSGSRTWRALAWAVAAGSLALPATAGALPISFSDPAQHVTGNVPRSIAVADFNGDGDLDLAVANEGDDNVSVLLGADGGAFSVGAPASAGNGPRAVVAGNFNGDADPDLAVANWGADTVSVLRGAGATAASFVPIADYAAGDGPRALALGLFNAGPDVDLAAANEFGHNVSVLLGGTGATFGTASPEAAGTSPSSVAAGDFNADGDPDLAVANLASDNVSVLLGGSGGTFGDPANIAVGNAPRSVVAADFNGDNDPDLAVANENTDDVTIVLGLAGTTFSGPTSVGAGDAPRALAAADFTRDGDLDLAVANTQSDSVSILVGGPGGSFADAVHVTVEDQPFSVATGDFDGDGEHDLAVGNLGSDNVSVLLNRTAPDTAIDGGPTGLSSQPHPTFAFSADEPDSTFECRLDAGPFSACTTPHTTAALTDGTHTFDVRAVDPAGNADQTPASRSFAIDATAPETAIDTAPGALTSRAAPTFGFSASEPRSTFQCRIDGAPFAACTSPLQAPALVDGVHTFEVRATDEVGNTDQTPASRSFTIDTAAPETRIDSGPSGLTTDRSPTFRFSATEGGSTFECRVDGGAYAPCSPPFTTNRLKRGPHGFEVRATDAAGNRDPSRARRSFTAVLRIRLNVSRVGKFGARFATLTLLAVKAVPRGARLQVRCRGRSCPFRRRTVKPDRRQRANVTRLFRGRSVRVGTVIEFRITARYAIGEVRRFRIRPNALPRSTRLCLPPGARKPQKRCPA